MTWAEFEEVFSDKYVPLTFRETMAQEFLELCQGSMTVAEYEAKFEELSRFGRMYIPDDAARAAKFRMGLHPSVSEKFATTMTTSYREVVESACMAEKSNQDLEKYYENTRQQFSGTGGGKRQKTEQIFEQTSDQRKNRGYDQRNRGHHGQGGRQQGPEVLDSGGEIDLPDSRKGYVTTAEIKDTFPMSALFPIVVHATGVGRWVTSQGFVLQQEGHKVHLSPQQQQQLRARGCLQTVPAPSAQQQQGARDRVHALGHETVLADLNYIGGDRGYLFDAVDW
ncbi:uncharacterized protein LOC120005682 [Tripterygium wilfordii]|uniref:uncharacterized protein LOC120005682 n=1 Tax=Tripterygium wilfordii TaxID=458696 RepID=UPI0018F83E00|nr:uncharacterized protein LOC120005682 [Tripterygium wilfordii]